MPIEARHLFRFYDRHCAVRDLDLHLSRGEVLGLLGPNGAGKSTTLQMLSGTLAPHAGQIRIDGIDLLESPQEARRRLGFLPERPPLYRDLTVDESLDYAARLRRIPAREVAAAVGQSKARCGLGSVGRRLIGNLSHGYRQRVGIAQAIVHAPAVVILDEPTNGLDPIQIHEMRQLIRDLAREHSVILSTHILPEVEAVCDRVQILVHGRSVFDSPLSELAQAEASAYRLRFAHPPQHAQLSAVEGVTVAEAVSSGRIRVRLEAETGVEALVRRSVELGWGLRELVPEGESLEGVFTRLVYADRGAAP